MPDDVLFIINTLCAAGYEAYAVGGCVRDSLLGAIPEDWDITTSALPSEVLDCFSGFGTVKNGMKHGTVGVILNRQMYEITTYRIDGEYSDNRRPDTVTFTSKLEADLARRDFTVNAMAMDKDGTVIDVFGGKDDLEKRIIRCVGEAKRRFGEDALRIMRALRFASYDGFSLDDETLIWANALAENLKTIAYERIYTELKKMLVRAGAGKTMLHSQPVFKAIFPTLKASPDAWAEICADVSRCRGSFTAALACILLNASPREELTRLKAETAVKKAIIKLDEMRSVPIKPNIIYLQELMNEYSRDSVKLLCLYNVCTKKAGENLLALAEEASAGCCSISELDISGNDIKELGYKKHMIKRELEYLLDAVIHKKCENKKDELIKYATENK